MLLYVTNVNIYTNYIDNIIIHIAMINISNNIPISNNVVYAAALSLSLGKVDITPIQINIMTKNRTLIINMNILLH